MELAKILAASEEVRRCWTWHWVRRMLPAEDPATVEPLVDELVATTTNDTPLRDVLLAIATSQRFVEVHRQSDVGHRDALWRADDDSCMSCHTSVTEPVRSLIDARCNPCSFEDGEAQMLADFSTDAGLLSHSRRVVKQVNASEMPPDKPLSAEEIRLLSAWLNTEGVVDEDGRRRAAEPVPEIATADPGAAQGQSTSSAAARRRSRTPRATSRK